MYAPRGYQQTLIDGAFDFWRSGGRNLMLVLPTGGGKTVVFSRIAAASQLATCAIAHRGELVSQISLAFAREGLRHRIVGPLALSRRCSVAHVEELGRDFVAPNSHIAVAGVDTLVKLPDSDPLFSQTRLWIQDECHHLLTTTKWGKAASRFPQAFGLGVTATPSRADGRGLGRHADGLFDHMLVGPSMRDLINAGYLTDYRPFVPPSDVPIDLSNVGTSESGDYSPPQLSAARRKSSITGDVVKHYLRIAPGKLGVTFDVDVESATETAAAYRAEGVPAEIVSGKTPDGLRAEILRRFRRREILQLVNVDLFGEGFDLPAIEVVSMARPTQSFPLFAQQFGRSLRIMDGKPYAIIIDHVGNILRHGLPDQPRAHTLDRRERRSRNAVNDVVPTRVCANPTCNGAYERVLVACPYCGTVPAPAARSTPEQVDGDLHELDPEVLRRMRGEVERIDGAPRFPANAGPEVVGAIKRTHWERQQAQAALRHVMAVWGGWQGHLGRPNAEAQRRFYFKFGIDVGSAQALNAADANALADRVSADLKARNVTGVM